MRSTTELTPRRRELKNVRRALPGHCRDFLDGPAREALVLPRVSQGEVRLGNLLGIPAALPNSLGRVEEKELPHLAVRQLPDRHAEPKNRILKLFCTEHRLADGPRDAAQFADMIPAGEAADVRIGEQHTAATRHLLGRHVQEMAIRRSYPPHTLNCPTKDQPRRRLALWEASTG